MLFFVIFIFGAVILGAGAMLSPAWPTAQPRVGLAAAFALAIITGGAVFMASLVGWQTLLIDYLLFALVVGIFLGGTLSVGQGRAERKGEELADEDQGWTGPQDLAMFAVYGLVFVLIAAALPLPLGPDAQTYGYLALAVREGGTLDTLAPFQPDVTYLYTPGFSALTAYLSGQLVTGIHTVQFGVAAVLSLLNVWLAYDFGGELRDKRLGRAMALAMFAGLALVGSLAHGHYPALLALLFAQAFFIFAIRYHRHAYPMDAFAAGLMLGAVALSQPGMTIAVLIGYVPWLVTMWLGVPPPSPRTWVVMAFGVPLVALLAIAPWLADIWPLLLDGPRSPLAREVENLFVIVQYHGIWVLGGAALGGWLGWNRRDPVAILALGWLFFIVDFSVSGGIARLFPFIDRYVNPLDLAWHAPIIPYMLLSGPALLWLWEALLAPRITPYTGGLGYRGTYVLAGVLALLAVGLFFARDGLRDLAAGTLSGSGVLATQADIDALHALRDDTAFDTVRILNPPLAFEADWVPVLAERPAVHYSQLPYAQAEPDIWEAISEEQAALLDFWRDPVGSEALIREAGITHVFVPAMLRDPDLWRETWRFTPPDLRGWDADLFALAEAPYLERVYSAGDTLTYRVLPLEDGE